MKSDRDQEKKALYWRKISSFSPVGNRFLSQTDNAQKRKGAISILYLEHKYSIAKCLVIENNLGLKAESD